MIRRWFILLIVAIVLLPASAQSPKRDFRAAWLSTVWAIDWPAHRDNTDEATKSQKRALRDILDNYEKCRINACFFQVRGMSDAMYRSKYEPWSQYLTGRRGKEPQYDPLAYLLEEAHARGIEVHAWLNPYRYATSSENYGTLPSDYSTVHPDWLIDCGGTTILNPGEPTVRKRIADVVADIVENYDVDGIVFDDYFYQSGMKDEYDDRLYALYNPDSLSRGDWRRRQVNLMVADVYQTIKTRKPWCRFGIGPAGVAASSKAVADKYGITPCPAGSDWQYNGIYSEPVQWFVDGSLDYMSPQVYWTIGSSSDYSKIAPWWYVVANKFGRHCFISQSLTSLSPTRSAPARSTFYAGEIVDQILIDHASTKENAPGSVFWSTNKIAITGFIKYVTAGAYTQPAIVPAMTWFVPDKEQGLVTHLQREGQVLSWQYAVSGQRFGIYAFPKALRHDRRALTTSLYYQGMTYNTSYTLADSIGADYAVAITVIDRYGNEYAPMFLGEETAATVTPQLLLPLDHAEILLPNYLTWQAVEDAMSYQVQVAYDADFTHTICFAYTDSSALLTQPWQAINGDSIYYWRVRACAPNRLSNWSEVRSFTGRLFSVTYPEDGASGVPVTPTMTWDDAGQGVTYTIEVAKANSFTEKDIIYSLTTTATEATLEPDILTYGANYYVRVKAQGGVLNTTSSPNLFTTEEVVMKPPVILRPSSGATVTTDSVTVEWDHTPNNGFRLEWAQSASFPNRSKKVHTVGIGIYSLTIGGLTEGTWYLRVATKRVDETWTDYSDVSMFNYIPHTGLIPVESIPSENRKVIIDGRMYIRKDGVLYSVLGNKVAEIK